MHFDERIYSYAAGGVFIPTNFIKLIIIRNILPIISYIFLFVFYLTEKINSYSLKVMSPFRVIIIRSKFGPFKLSKIFLF